MINGELLLGLIFCSWILWFIIGFLTGRLPTVEDENLGNLEAKE